MRYFPMLAEVVTKEDVCNRKDLVFQLKLDGQRAIWDGKEQKLWSRQEVDVTHRFPKIVEELKLLGNVVIDGEIVVLDKNGQDSFELLQKVAHLEDVEKIKKLNDELNTVYYVFDIIEKNGKYIGFETYEVRHNILNDLFVLTTRLYKNISLLLYSDDFNKVWSYSREGVMAKRKDSIYKQYRSDDWLKIKKWMSEIIEFDAYEEHKNGEGITLMNKSGDRVSVGSAEVAEKIKASMKVRYEKGYVILPIIKCEVQHFGRTPEGRTRFPTFKRVME